MTSPTDADDASAPPSANSRLVEVKGQVRAVQMDPPDGEIAQTGGAFELLLDNGDIITCPYPAQWHGYVAGAFQANDVRRAIVSGIGEYSADGKLQRISEIETFTWTWAWDDSRESA